MNPTTCVNDWEPAPASGGWTGSELAAAPESWRLPVADDVREELLRVAGNLPSGGAVTDPFRPKPVVSERTQSLVAEAHRRLAGEPGFVVLTGFPVPEQLELIEAVYWAFGLLLGRPTRETANDEPLIMPIENVGRDAGSKDGQGYRLPIALPFHVDRGTDLVSLLCVRPARSGGMSRLVSSKKLHNILLEEHPDLLSTLYEPFPFSMPPLRAPVEDGVRRWCEIPIFGRVKDRFSAHYVRRFVEQSQAFDDAPRLTRRQVAALDAVDEVLARPELPFDMSLRTGDLQVVNNLYVLHSRTAYDDENAERGRLLLRMHLAFAGSPALPAGYALLFGATSAGTYRGGTWRIGNIRERLGTPLGAAGVA